MTTIRTRLVATVAATAAAATVGLAGPAQAQTWDREDAVGDTWRYTYTGSEETGAPAPEASHNDIAAVSARHARRVSVTATGVDFTRETEVLIYQIRDGRRQVWVLQRVGSDRGQSLVAFRGRRECRSARGSVDRAADVATVSVPRRCLGQPDTVRVGVGVVSYEEVNRRRLDILLDDGLLDGEPQDELTLSPRIARGPGTVG
jgi:hypothetical protein